VYKIFNRKQGMAKQSGARAKQSKQAKGKVKQSGTRAK